MNDIKKDRIYYLDWLRVIGMLVVFYFHCAHIFDPLDYHVKNAEKSMFLFIFVTFAIIWMMPLFFWVAGASSRFAFGAKTTGNYIAERFKRLAIPFLVGVVILIPPQDYVESLQKNRFFGSFFEYLPHQLRVFWPSPISPDYFGSIGHHLWFVAFLFVFTVLAVPIFRFLQNDTGRQAIAKLVSVCEPQGMIYLFALPLAAIYMLLKPLSPEYCGWADFLYWFVIFIYGFIFLSNDRCIKIIRDNRIISLIVGIASFGVLIALLANGVGNRYYDSPDYSFGCLAFQLLWAITAWAWMIFFIGSADRFLNFKNKLLTYANEAALPFYLLHQTVILLVAFYIVQLHWNIASKFFAISTASLIIVMALYEMMVRRINPIRVLFGMKQIARVTDAKDSGRATHALS